MSGEAVDDQIRAMKEANVIILGAVYGNQRPAQEVLRRLGRLVTSPADQYAFRVSEPRGLFSQRERIQRSLCREVPGELGQSGW